MRLEAIDPAQIERLKPLWLALHHHHKAIAPQLAPFVSDEVSWSNRKRQYTEIFTGEFFGLIANFGGADAGYLLCARRPMPWQATFDISPTLWELVTIIVLPELRGEGVGKTLLNAMDARIGKSDVQTLLIGVIPGNSRAVQLYQARGHAPAWVILTRFQRRPLRPVRQNIDATVTVADIQDVNSLERLWLSLHHHHQTVSPHLGPWVDDKRSWSVVRDIFARSATEGLLFVARREGEAVGLACVAIYDAADHPGWADTFVTENRVAETKFLVVEEADRGKGLGAALMRAVDDELEKRGVRDHFIGAIAPNNDAIRFYESLGYRQSWIELVRK